MQARGARFVAVRPPVVKNSAELPAQLRDILTKTEMGKLTPPETTQQGVEVYAVCGRKQSDNAPEKKEIRDQLYSETFDNLAKTVSQFAVDHRTFSYLRNDCESSFDLLQLYPVAHVFDLKVGTTGEM